MQQVLNKRFAIIIRLLLLTLLPQFFQQKLRRRNVEKL